MSWFSDNYEKVALGGAVLVAIGLGYSGFQSLGSVEEVFSQDPKGKGPTDASVQLSDEVVTAISSFEIERKWTKTEDASARPVDLFTGVPLFVNRDNLKQPVDLPKSESVHPPISNKWWIEYRIDPGFADSPQRDEDEDGFTNLEEYNGQTDPTDKRSHPNLIQKLTYVGSESVEWVLRPSGFPSEEAPEPNMGFEYNDSKKKSNRVSIAEPIPKGGMFFASDPMKGRFKYLGTEQRIVRNERIQEDETVWIVKIEDLKTNKKGRIYEIPDNFKRGDANKYHQFDRTAKFSLEALGLNGQVFKVEENVDFALPADGKEKRYKLMEIGSDRIMVREALEDGTTKDHQIIKNN
jgi:hypothetical protein